MDNVSLVSPLLFPGSEMYDKTDAIKAAGDISAASITVATILNWLPAVAAIFTIVWTITRLYESLTGRPFSESAIAKFLTGRK